MVNMTDKVVLDLGDEELAEYITGKSPGDECKMEITATLDELTDEQAVFSIKEVSVEHEETDYEEEDDGEESPVMAVMMAGKKEKEEDSY